MWRAALVSLCTLLPGSALCPTPLEHGAYVWQRAHGPAVTAALAEAPSELASFVWLAAEIDPRARPETTLVPLAAARASGRPVGLAVRVHELPAAALEAPLAPRALLDAVDTVAARARAEGISPTELQLDFDCPTRGLDAYAAWLPQLAGRAGDVPLTITALPAWLGSPAFARLARASSGFVLQVHSLELPATRDGHASVFDLHAARRAVSRAARVGVPFRVALPTHAYSLAYDARGGLADVRAEDDDDAPPDREVAARPEDLSAFVRWLRRARPREAIGVAWFRLPTRDDRRSVTMAGLASLIEGGAPAPRLRASARRDDDGALAIEVSNDGDAPALAPRVEVAFDAAELEAFDATSARATRGDGRIVFDGFALGPRATRSLGWVRLASTAGARVTLDAR